MQLHGDWACLEQESYREYQRPIAGHALAREDTCPVAPQGGLKPTCSEQDDIG